jgi:cysteine desulfurase
MAPYLYGHFGNPSSGHPYGLEAKRAVEVARAEVAALLECEPGDIVFTSGGTESNNYAIKGIALARRRHPQIGGAGHIVTSAIEHPATIEVCRWLESQGFGLTVLPLPTHSWLLSCMQTMRSAQCNPSPIWLRLPTVTGR